MEVAGLLVTYEALCHLRRSIQLGGVGSYYPMSENPDMGHPVA
jgi:hypothetical protein